MVFMCPYPRNSRWINEYQSREFSQRYFIIFSVLHQSNSVGYDKIDQRFRVLSSHDCLSHISPNLLKVLNNIMCMTSLIFEWDSALKKIARKFLMSFDETLWIEIHSFNGYSLVIRSWNHLQETRTVNGSNGSVLHDVVWMTNRYSARVFPCTYQQELLSSLNVYLLINNCWLYCFDSANLDEIQSYSWKRTNICKVNVSRK